jgi:hypothetical protein
MSTLSKQIVIAPQEIFVESTTQGTDLGQMAVTGDGRAFRYVKAGAVNLIAGNLQQGPATDDTNLNPAGGLAVGQAVATGGVSFTISTSTTNAANVVAGGIMAVVAGVGTGFAYKVKSNTVAAGATGMAIVLEDPIQQNFTTATKVAFQPNPYNGVVIVPAARTAAPVGVAVNNLTASSYGWVQTRGLASVKCGATGIAGTAVGTTLVNVTGAVSNSTGFASFSQVGIAVGVSNYNEYGLVQLQLD